MGGASPRPRMHKPPLGRQRPWSRERCIRGVWSVEPVGPNLPVPFMRAPRQPAIRGCGSVPGRKRTRSTWNACRGLGGLPSVDDRQRFARRGAAVAAPPTSGKRVRGATRWSPWSTETKTRALTAPREDLLAGNRGAISSAARHLAMPALERVGSPRAAHGGVCARARVEVELPAMRVRAQQGEGICTPRPRRPEIAREAGGGGRSTWNVSGDVWLEAGDVPGDRARGGRIADQRGTVEATAGPRISA
jgi:hypothetical protein